MKKIISIICLISMILMLSSVGYCNDSYNAKYLGEKAISDMRFIPYITWSFVAMVGGRVITHDGVDTLVGDKDYNIVIKGTDTLSNTTAYYGEFTGNLTKGLNTLVLSVKGKSSKPMKWQIQIELSDIVSVSPSPSETPATSIATSTPTPIINSETPVTSNSIETPSTSTPVINLNSPITTLTFLGENKVISNTSVTSKEELPKTGDTDFKVSWLIGFCITLFGGIWGVIRFRKIQKDLN